MPFTFSHPAAILPLNYLKKGWVSLTGLVIGSIVPDFEYFIRMKDRSIYSHTWPGMLWFELPLGLLLTFVYHYLVRDSLLRNLPALFQKRLLPFSDFNWQEWFKRNSFTIIVCIIIGSCSHLLWDRLTHETVQFVDTSIPVVREKINTHLERKISYYLFWNFSSLIGALVVLYGIWQMPVHKHIKPRTDAFYWIIVSIITFMVVIIRELIIPHIPYYDFVVTIISGFIIALILTPQIVRYNHK
jgi:hypothetical protein